MEILEAVNRSNGLRASQIARIVKIPRPTTYRLLETLEEMGFVVRGASDDNWRPTLQTKSLSSGFREEDWIAQTAVPQMIRLGRQVLWPIDLVTFRDYKMAVRESTHNISPYSVDHGMVGRELPMLTTSGGRAYLAFTSEQDRAHILAGLRERLGEAAIEYQDDGPLDYILERTRKLGLGFRLKDFNDRTMSISAPILGAERPIACLTMIWIASAKKFDEAIAAYSEALLSTASSIADELSRLSPQKSDSCRRSNSPRSDGSAAPAQ